MVNGARKAGFDHERGKGVQCHLNGEELPYTFSGVDRWLEDFITEVDKRGAR